MEDLIGYLDEIQSQLIFAAENRQQARRRAEPYAHHWFEEQLVYV
jgi:hypothetical protein